MQDIGYNEIILSSGKKFCVSYIDIIFFEICVTFHVLSLHYIFFTPFFNSWQVIIYHLVAIGVLYCCEYIRSHLTMILANKSFQMPKLYDQRQLSKECLLRRLTWLPSFATAVGKLGLLL